MSLKTWERRGKRGLARVLGRALRVTPEAEPPPDLATLRSILLIRTQNQLGDFLLGTPALRAVRERAPAARIDLLVGAQNVAPALGNERVDDVLVFEKRVLARDPRRMRAFVARLRDARYDLALVLSTVDFSTTALGLAALSGAARRAGRPGTKDSEKAIARDAFHWVLPPAAVDRHQTAAHLDLVAAFRAPWADGAPEIFLTKEEEERGALAMDETIGNEAGGLRIVVHPGAGKLPNRWDAARFGEVAAALSSDGHALVATAGPGEEALLDRLDHGAGRRIARLPALSIRELAGALRRADLVLANDTGVLHVAAAAGAHALALFGPTDPRVWCPASRRVFFLRAPDGDLARLATAPVVAVAGAFARHVASGTGIPPELEPAPSIAP